MLRLIAVFLVIITIDIGCLVAAEDAVTNAEPQPSSAVKPFECYACVNCPQVENETNKRVCPYTFDSTKDRCVMYAEKHPYMMKKDMTLVIRGCASDKGSCVDIRKAYAVKSPDLAKLEYCNECEGDLCNGVSRSLPGIFGFFAVVLTPILMYILS